MSKHTPGPWRVAGENHANVILCERFVVADVYRHQPDDIGPSTREEGQSNAALIAAAPDLLAALVAIRESPQFRNRLENGIQQIVHAAIAKAEGGAA